MLGRLVVILVVTQLCSGFVSATTSKVVCYHGTWAKYRNGNGAYGVKNIDTSKCTHVIYSFVGLSDDGTIRTLDSYLDYDLDNLNEFTRLKNSNNNLKTLVAIGGWNEGSVKFSNVAASASLRATFIQSALDFVLKYNFDGFDFDWEYPAQRGGAAADKQNFITLLREFRQVFKSHNLLVSAAVAAAASSVSLSYDVAALSDNLDFINVMAYDLHASWDGVTGHNAPLYASSIDVTSAAKQLNVDSIITNWINRGAAPEKLILGIPLYGRSFTLSSSSNVRLGASSSGAGIAGPYTLEAGYLGYNEICEKLAEGGWTYVWDKEQQVPHIYKGDQWIGYDDPTAVQLKVKYAQDKKLGGVMVWAIETDDFKGISGVKHALLAAIQQQLGTTSDSTNANADVPNPPNVIPDNSPTERQVVTTTTTVSSASNSKSVTCTNQGYVRDPKDCQVFYYCDENKIPHKFKCTNGLYYDTSTGNCDWADNVQGC